MTNGDARARALGFALGAAVPCGVGAGMGSGRLGVGLLAGLAAAVTGYRGWMSGRKAGRAELATAIDPIVSEMDAILSRRTRRTQT